MHLQRQTGRPHTCFNHDVEQLAQHFRTTLRCVSPLNVVKPYFRYSMGQAHSHVPTTHFTSSHSIVLTKCVLYLQALKSY